MASIQQSLNQALYQGTIGVHIYAQSPAAKLKALVQKKQSLENLADIETEVAEKYGEADVAYQERAQDIAKTAKEIYTLNPTEKAYTSYQRALDEAYSSKRNFMSIKETLENKNKEENE